MVVHFALASFFLTSYVTPLPWPAFNEIIPLPSFREFARQQIHMNRFLQSPPLLPSPRCFRLLTCNDQKAHEMVIYKRRPAMCEHRVLLCQPEYKLFDLYFKAFTQKATKYQISGFQLNLIHFLKKLTFLTGIRVTLVIHTVLIYGCTKSRFSR